MSFDDATEASSRLEAMSVLLVGQAALLEETVVTTSWRPGEHSPAASESVEALDGGLPELALAQAWQAANDYASATTHHLRGLAQLILAGQLLTVPLVARSVLEHAQRTLWLLEATHGSTKAETDRVTARQRAGRGQLELLFSDRHYRDMAEKLAKGTAAVSDAKARLKARRNDIQAWFGAGTVTEGEPKLWVVEGQRFPGPTAASEWYFDTMSRGNGQGVYDALSGWSHPTLWGIRDHQNVEPTPDGGVRITLSHDLGFIERVCATTIATVYRMVMQLFGYYGWPQDSVEAYADAINVWMPDVIIG